MLHAKRPFKLYARYMFLHMGILPITPRLIGIFHLLLGFPKNTSVI